MGWLPPGLFHDEAAIGLDALDILTTGRLSVYFERTTGGQEPLFGYLTTLSMLALGPGVLAMRVVAPIVGMVTVAVTYALGKEMFGRWVGLTAALLMAVSYWHVHESHTSFRAITLPLMVGTTFLLLWRALKRQGAVAFLLAGLSAAATMYTYQSSRVFPLLLALVFLYLWVCLGPGLPWRGLAIFAGVIVVFTVPLAWYYIGHPELFYARIDQVGAGGEAALDSLANAIGMFSYQGDITWKFNLPGKPVFDPAVSVLFYLGVAVALWRWRQPAYGLVLLWTGVMLLPSALSTESPHFLRALGVMPAIYVLPGIGLAWLGGFFKGWIGKPSIGWAPGLAHVVLAGWLAAGAAATYRDYFGEWASSPNAYEAYDGDVGEAARYLNTLDGSQVVMFSSRYYRHYTVLFFEGRDLDLRWFDGRQSLPLPEVDGREVVYVLPASAMPPRPLLDSVLGRESLAREGRGPQGQLSFLAYRLTPEKLALARASLAPPEPLEVKLGQEVQILGYRLGDSGPDSRPVVRPGETLSVALYWRVLSRTGSDYSFFSHLLDQGGRMWGQGDANQYWSSEWRPGDLVLGRYDIAVDPQAPAGRLRVEVGLVDRRDGKRAAVSTGGEAQVLEAVKVAQVSQPSLETLGQAQLLGFGDAIDFLGYSLQKPAHSGGLPVRVMPGEPLSFAFFWRAKSAPREDYTVFLHLVDESGRLVAQADGQPQGGAFPTSYWEPGEVVADQVQLALPRDVAPGIYKLRMGLYQLASGQRLPVSARGTPIGDQAGLGEVEVMP
ncbi:MAG TPA: glycosyltransferase family 39 protein [Dehalococcoidia bacterium]|nr:glycosyltransferase family 39 protein [Dehalococcoidia bacterium]